MTWALLILGVVLSAFARMTIVSLQTVGANEARTRATALQSEMIEKLQGLEWYLVAIYDEDLDDIDGQPLVTDDDSDGQADHYDGEELVLTEADVQDENGSIDSPDCDAAKEGGTVGDRDLQVPCPLRTIEREGTEYTVWTYITRVDRDGDATTEDTRHFTVIVEWDDQAGHHRSEADAERSAVATLNRGLEIINYEIAADPTELDGNGRTVTTDDPEFDAFVQFNTFMPHDPVLTFLRVIPDAAAADADADEENIEDQCSSYPCLYEDTLNLTQLNPDRVTFTSVAGDFDPDWRYAEGHQAWLVEATKDSTTVDGSFTIGMRGDSPWHISDFDGSGDSTGPVTVTGPSPDPGKDDTPTWEFTGSGDSDFASFECRLKYEGDAFDAWSDCSASHTSTLVDTDGDGNADEGTYTLEVRERYETTDDDGNVTTTYSAATSDTYTYAVHAGEPISLSIDTVSQFCVDNAGHLSRDVDVTMTVEGVDADDVVELTYPYWTPGNKSPDPDASNTVTASPVAGGDFSSRQFTVTIGPDTQQTYKHNKTVTLNATVTRSPDDANAFDSTNPQPVEKEKKC